jgi:hypothetical protein
MYLEHKSYGLRSRVTGDLVRIELYDYHDEDSVHTDKALVLDKDQPVFQSKDLNDLMRGRFGREFFGFAEPRFDGVVSRLGDMDAYEIVEFVANPAGDAGRDPENVTVDVRALEFRLVEGVRMQHFNEQDSCRLMEAAFPAGEVERFPDCVVKPVVLKGSDVSDLEGGILLPPPNKLLLRQGPMGVLVTRTVGETTYALVTQDVARPELHVVMPPPVQEIDELPWGDCKVAFGWDASDEGDELLTEIWDEEIADRSKSIWPEGWSINETDGAGARYVIVFRIEGNLPTREDGERVQELVSMIERGVDPRELVAPAYGR